MERYIGLDAHASSCTLGIVGPSGKRLGSQVVETNAQALIEVLRGIPRNRRQFRRLGERAKSYDFLVGDTVRVKNRLKSVLRSRGVAYGAGDSVYLKRDREEWLARLPEASRATAEKALLAEARKHREWHVLKTCPGLGAATTVIGWAEDDPLYRHYERLLDGGTKPNLAKLTIARQLASIVLAVWRTGEAYDPKRLEALEATK